MNLHTEQDGIVATDRSVGRWRAALKSVLVHPTVRWIALLPLVVSAYVLVSVVSGLLWPFLTVLIGVELEYDDLAGLILRGFLIGGLTVETGARVAPSRKRATAWVVAALLCALLLYSVWLASSNSNWRAVIALLSVAGFGVLCANHVPHR